VARTLVRLAERPDPRMRTVEGCSAALAAAGTVTVPIFHLVFVTLCRTTFYEQKPIMGRRAVATTMRGLPNLEAAFRETVEDSARLRQGIEEGAIGVLRMVAIDMGHCVKNVYYTSGMDDVITDPVRHGESKGYTGSKRIIGQEGPEMTATATALDMIRHRMDESLQRGLSRIAVAILSRGPNGVNPSSMKLG
jgi:hypothetical protein